MFFVTTRLKNKHVFFSFLRSVVSRIEKEQHRRFRLQPKGGDIFRNDKGPVSWPLWELFIFPALCLHSSFGHSFSHKYDDFDISVPRSVRAALSQWHAQLVFQINYRVHQPLIVVMFLRHAGVMMVTSLTPLSPSVASTAVGLVNLSLIKFEHHACITVFIWMLQNVYILNYIFTGYYLETLCIIVCCSIC